MLIMVTAKINDDEIRMFWFRNDESDNVNDICLKDYLTMCVEMMTMIIGTTRVVKIIMTKNFHILVAITLIILLLLRTMMSMTIL